MKALEVGAALLLVWLLLSFVSWLLALLAALGMIARFLILAQHLRPHARSAFRTMQTKWGELAPIWQAKISHHIDEFYHDTAPWLLHRLYIQRRPVKACQICLNDQVGSDRTLIKLVQCGDELCWRCVRAYCNDQTERSLVLPLRCPFQPRGCAREVTSRDLHCAFGPMSTISVQRIEQLQLTLALAAMRDVLKCSACAHAVTIPLEMADALGDPKHTYWREPSRLLGLRSGRFRLDGCGRDRRKFVCERCNMASCVLCQRGWVFGVAPAIHSHDEISCKEHLKAFAATYRDNEQWIADHAKRCPQCRAPIFKDGGCEYMRCQACQYEFCFNCLVYLPGHRRHVCTGKVGNAVRNRCVLQ